MVLTYQRDHNVKNMTKKKRLEHKKLRIELKKQKEDLSRNVIYSLETGYSDNQPVVVATLYVHYIMGCAHKTKRRQHCICHNFNKNQLGKCCCNFNIVIKSRSQDILLQGINLAAIHHVYTNT